MANRKQSWWWERIGCQLALRIQQWPLSFSFFVKSAYSKVERAQRTDLSQNLISTGNIFPPPVKHSKSSNCFLGIDSCIQAGFRAFFFFYEIPAKKNTRWKVRNLIFLKKDSTSWKSESIKCSPSKQGGPGCSHRKKYQMKSYKPSIPRKRQQFSY